MEYNKKITIVVPIYNVENYLAACLDSLINQSVSNYEIILVNDGSTDTSGYICNQYAGKSSLIKVIHKNNQGVAKARRSGVELAEGEYLLFVDSDDLINSNALKKLGELLDLGDVDLIGFNSGTVIKDMIKVPENNPNLIVEYNKEEFVSTVIFEELIKATKASVVWNKLYKTEYVKKYIKNYGESVLEDYLFNIQYFEHVNKYVYTDDVLYYYRILTDSLSKKYNKNAYGVLKEIQIKKDTFIKIMKMNSEDVELYNYFWFVNYTKNILFTLFLSSNLHDIISSLKIAKSIVLSKELLNVSAKLN